MRVQQAYEADNPRPVADAATVADHLDHMREVAGIDHIGIGGDFDGTAFAPGTAWRTSPDTRTSSRSCCGRGWSETDLAKLTWHNAVRVLRDAEAVSA